MSLYALVYRKLSYSTLLIKDACFPEQTTRKKQVEELIQFGREQEKETIKRIFCVIGIFVESIFSSEIFLQVLIQKETVTFTIGQS